MKSHVIGVFNNRDQAERAIELIHNEVGVDTDEISYVYRNADGEVREMNADEATTDTPAEGAEKGAKTGAVVGALAGLAVVAGVAPALGAIFAAGPLVSALGITGAVGTTAAGAVTGAAVGGLIGALVNLGVDEDKAKVYEERVMAGDILVAVHTDKTDEALQIMNEKGASEVDVYSLTV